MNLKISYSKEADKFLKKNRDNITDLTLLNVASHVSRKCYQCSQFIQKIPSLRHPETSYEGGTASIQKEIPSRLPGAKGCDF